MNARGRSEKGSILLVLLCCIGLACVSAATAGQPPPGAFRTPFTVFRGRTAGLKMAISLVEGRIGFDAHALVTCANDSSHWQLVIEGGRGGHVDAKGRFHHVEYEAAEAGEVPPVTQRVTIEGLEEGIRYGVPAEFREIKGRVLRNRVVGWIRYWEGPGRTPKSLHYKCGTDSPQGGWVKFSLPRVNGPAQPDGHRPPRGEDSRLVERRLSKSTIPARGEVGGPPEIFLASPPPKPHSSPVVLGVGGRPRLEIVGYDSVQGPCVYADEPRSLTIFGQSCNAGFGSPVGRQIFISGAGAGYVGRSHRRYSEVEGYLGPDVASVRIRYRFGGEARTGTAVVGRVKGGLLSRIGQTESFGLFTFAINRCVTSDMTVVALDRAGTVLEEASSSDGPLPIGPICPATGWG